jgi:hypothetical protein
MVCIADKTIPIFTIPISALETVSLDQFHEFIRLLLIRIIDEQIIACA